MPLPAAIMRIMAGALITCALGLVISPNHASAFCHGNLCLPGSGYTLDVVWNCGQIHSEVQCFYREVTVLERATPHTFGFGSASYGGEGSVEVTVEARTRILSYFGGSGTNLIRTCYEENCNDQEETSLFMRVSNGGFHTVSGHGEA